MSFSASLLKVRILAPGFSILAAAVDVTSVYAASSSSGSSSAVSCCGASVSAAASAGFCVWSASVCSASCGWPSVSGTAVSSGAAVSSAAGTSGATATTSRLLRRASDIDTLCP